MKGNAWKWLAIGGALAIVVLFGIEMTSSGIERIYGPIEGEASYGTGTGLASQEERGSYESETDKRIAQLEKELEEIRRAYGYNGERLPGMPNEDEAPAVNKLADSTSGMLQSASSKGIRFVVDLFDGLIH
ncbi:hypothetical protein [Paenibacillus soyae]|uniref:Uncharacterized protein n=1 Tax=Paenibacillus soyae TaxID=2969249 RepID=A0A9X2MP22_9BACL|nr:hypothetical protein [Paenibacillus soyae]MCR2803206.1 hypothetical protein [Paenibacillus soyae]